MAFPPAVTKRAATEHHPDEPAPSSRPGPLTTLIPLRAGTARRVVLRLKVGLGDERYELGRLKRLGFLHTGRWQVVRSFPFNGPPQRPEFGRTAYFLFASDYDGQFNPYIDAFSDVLAWRLDTLWHWCEEFPGAHHSAPFKDYIRKWELKADHYYSAYPDAPAKTIDQALALATAWQRFNSAWGGGVDAEKFHSAFRRFVRENQARL